MHRSKSASNNKKDPTNDVSAINHTTSKKQRRHHKSSTLENRPEWNNDTKIDGYDDVDENGRYRHRGVELNRAHTKAEQEELNQAWLESLRGDFHHERHGATSAGH
ncbi:unnamed protein product [Strongylus vulgaris]|uniref:Uncharacterized protein n=1 Tax=Strongylus vulgaris TaxID=40348 RepID=A0A3P7JYG7_STRVU|nr:unnamed protein product [Strongylus vulgaris]